MEKSKKQMKYIAYKTSTDKQFPSNWIVEWKALSSQEIDNKAEMALDGWRFLFEKQFQRLLLESNTDENYQAHLLTLPPPTISPDPDEFQEFIMLMEGL